MRRTMLTAAALITVLSVTACGGNSPGSVAEEAAPASAGSRAGEVLFEEDFESSDWEAQGWYDNPQIEVSERESASGNRSCVWDWKRGERLPGGKGGRVRLDETESVTLSYMVRHSDNWQWTGRGYHPHEFLFMTNKDEFTRGPAYTHLTLYVEAVDGKPTLAIQDGLNIDTTRLGEDLTGVTEKRAVAGGNGSPDGYPGHHYEMTGVWRNTKQWDPGEVWFSDRPGPRYKGDWHEVKARFVLNSIVDGKGVADGVMQYWQDGELLMDYHDVMFRTGEHPDMKINQFMMLPYIGPGAKADQQVWIDDIRITR